MIYILSIIRKWFHKEEKKLTLLDLEEVEEQIEKEINDINEYKL